MIKFALLFFVGIALAATPVAAEKNEDFWHLSNFTNPKTQRFEYCAVESGFDNGLSLAFARNRDFYTNIIVGFTEPKLEQKTKYRLLVGVDGHAPTEITGFAADPKALVIPVQKDKKLLAELRAGNLLEIKGPQDAIKFSLNGAGKAFDQLQDCIEKSLKEETRKTPVPASEPAKRALTVLSETAETPGGEGAGEEVEPIPLPKEPLPPLKTEASAAAPAVQTPVSQPVPQPEIQPPSAPSVPAAPPASAVPETVPASQREPVQTARLGEAQPLTSVSQPPQMAAEPAPAAVAAPAAVPEGLRSAPYDQIVVVPNSAGASGATPAMVPANAVPPPVSAPALPVPVVQAQVQAPAPASSPVRPAPVVVTGPVVPQRFTSLALPAVLSSLGLEAKREKTASRKVEKYYWHEGDLAGTATSSEASQKFLDHMLAAVDEMEKSCRNSFTSDLGAPTQKAGLVYAEAVVGCGSGASAIQGAVLFYQTDGKFVVFTEQGQAFSRPVALQRRENLKNELLLSTNYK
jgi:hypothetical protein